MLVSRASRTASGAGCAACATAAAAASAVRVVQDRSTAPPTARALSLPARCTHSLGVQTPRFAHGCTLFLFQQSSSMATSIRTRENVHGRIDEQERSPIYFTGWSFRGVARVSARRYGGCCGSGLLQRFRDRAERHDGRRRARHRDACEPPRRRRWLELAQSIDVDGAIGKRHREGSLQQRDRFAFAQRSSAGRDLYGRVRSARRGFVGRRGAGLRE